ncbi:MAG: carboxymuconolactone decarboxylase family protein [Pseudomonadota bacterium]
MARVRLAGDSSLPNSQRVRSHCPELLEGLNAFYDRIWRSSRVDASVKELIRMRCATINQCEY